VSSNTSNWISDAAAAGILGASAVMGEYSDTDLEPYLSGCILKVGALIDNTFDRDGAYGEGALYYSHALHCLTKTMPVLDRLYGVRFPDDMIARSCDFLIYQTDAATGRIYDYGDAFETISLFRQDGYLGFGNMAYLAGKFRDPHLMWYYKLNPGLTERDLIFLDESVEARPPDDLPRTKLFRDAGTAVFRSGFGADDFMFVFRCGAFFNHHHFDQGSFFLQDRGVELLTESGRTDYYADPWYRKLFIQAGGHNCVLVDENPESQKAGDFLYDVPAWRDYASITDFISFDGGACVSGRLDPLYKGKLSNLRRTVLYVEPRTIVLIDEASGAEDTRQINLLFHAPERDDIAIADGGAAVERSGVRLGMRTIGPESLVSEILKRPMTINEFNRSNTVTMKARGYLRQTAMLGWGGDATVVANIMSTDTAVLASLNERITDEYARVNLAGKDFMINRTGGRTMSVGGVVTDALVYAARSDGYVAIRATSLTVDGENALSADAPVSVEVRSDGRMTYSAGTDVTAAFRRSSKPKKVLIDGAASKDWQYRNGSLVIKLRDGTGEIELQ
jgi:hypothetical protein